MTELNTASSDAKNVNTTATLMGGEYVINGEKHYISGAGDPRCKIMITMVQTDPNAPPALRQSQILVPLDTPGVEIVGGQQVFGDYDAPHGHMHIRFNNARVPAENILLGEGRGFEISQLRLGPGRIHHCMRAIGSAEKALDLMVQRGMSRTAFGKPLIQLGGNLEIVSRARIDIEAMRLMVLKAAGRWTCWATASARSGFTWSRHGARAGLHHHRPGDPDVRRAGRVAAHPAGAHVRQHPHAAHRDGPTRCTTWWWAATSCISSARPPTTRRWRRCSATEAVDSDHAIRPEASGRIASAPRYSPAWMRMRRT
jgi:alkylation response protein AidB-like acyl-CoA dehydrogenase